MSRTLLSLMLFAVVALAACSKDDSGSAGPGNAPKAEARKSSKADEAPRVVDPLKEGY